MKLIYIYSFLIVITYDVNAQVFQRLYGGYVGAVGYDILSLGEEYLIAGNISTSTQVNKSCLIKTTASGDTIWTKTYFPTTYFLKTKVKKTFDGGFILTGTTSLGHDVFLIKTDSIGDTLWTRVFEGPLEEFGKDVQQTSDSGFVVAGETISFGAGGEDVF